MKVVKMGIIRKFKIKREKIDEARDFILDANIAPDDVDDFIPIVIRDINDKTILRTDKIPNSIHFNSFSEIFTFRRPLNQGLEVFDYLSYLELPLIYLIEITEPRSKEEIQKDMEEGI